MEKSGTRHNAIEKLKNFENFDFLYLNKNVKHFNFEILRINNFQFSES